MTAHDRRKKLCRAMRLAWGSLISHMPDPEIKHDATAMREYAEIIYICASELEAQAEK